MAVEIKELIIKATVNSGSKTESGSDQSGYEDEIVSNCVEQVLKILERKQER